MQEKLLLLGRKIGMTQLFDEKSCIVPVTVIQIETSRISQLKTVDTDGYNSVQLAFGSKNSVSKPVLGHLKKAGIEDKLGYFREFTVESHDGFELGADASVELFTVGQMVDVIGETKGRGFQGVVKRYDFAGGRDSHGSMSHRRGGSYGHFRRMGHVIKNQKMPGHMGCDRRTVQNLLVVKIVPEKNLILVKGSVPGSRGGLVAVRKAKKS